MAGFLMHYAAQAALQNPEGAARLAWPSSRASSITLGLRLMAAQPAIVWRLGRHHLVQTGFPALRNWTPTRVRLSVRKAA